MIKVSRINALCAGIALAMAGSTVAADNGNERVWVKFTPGAKGNVENALRAAGGRIHHAFDDLGAFAVSVPPQALNGLRNNPNIEYIEEDVIRAPMAQTVPYGIPMVQAPDAWAAGGDGSGILVCVIDSGIAAQHEDLGNITGGYPSGWNNDTCGHGTHVAGSVGALDNNTGVVGVAPNASFYIVQVFNGSSCGWSYSSTLVDAANRCAQQGTSQGKRVVINMSLGGGRASTTENNGFANLYASGNVLSIAAAGNAGNTTKSYPASYDSVMSVAAVDSNKALASFSQRNDQVEIAAPGVDVLSTMPFSEAAVSVSGQGFMVSAMEGTWQGSASGALVDGGRCTGSNGGWSGKVVLCERGDISFADKNTNVQNSGGAAAIIYNNEAGSFGGTLGGANSTIPSVSMSQEDGQFLVASRIGSTANVSTAFQMSNSAYGFMSGTSMASPHAAGAAAAIWSTNPAASNADVRSAMTSTAEDLGSAGRDNSFGWGLVRTADAIAALGGGDGGGGGGGGDDGGGDDGGSDFELAGTAYKVKGRVSVDLVWAGASSGSVDIFRNGSKVATTANSGAYTDDTGLKGGGSLSYRVCEAGTATCSDDVTVNY